MYGMLILYVGHIKVDVKLTLEETTKAQRGEQMYSSTLPSTSALDGVWVVNVTPLAALPLGKTRYPFYRRLGGLQGRSGRVLHILVLLLLLLLQFSFHSVAVVLTLVQTKQIIYINNTKTQYKQYKKQ